MGAEGYILGLNAFHGDAAACLLRDGVLVAAAEEERFRRIKHWAGFPSEAVAWCLRDAGIGLHDLAHVAVNQDSRAHLGRKLAYAALHRPPWSLIADRLRNRQARQGVADQLLAAFPGQSLRAGIHAVEHHRAHLSSAFHASPFEQAVVVSVDGFGDFASAAWGTGRGTVIDVDARVFYPHSLGTFYQALTQFLGFPNYGDEYKVMGLAPYGEPRFLPQLRQVVHLLDGGAFALELKYFRHHREKVAYEWTGGSPRVGTLWSPALETLLGPARREGEPLTPRHHDLARSVQALYEEAFFHLLRALHGRYGLDRLALAGGCAMNSVANGKITRQTPFREVYVQSAAGDAGGAVGAALTVWHGLGGARMPAHTQAGWGPCFSDAAIGEVLTAHAAALQAGGCRVAHVADEDALCDETARAIAGGEVVGWFQGRMEWGPRALGHRSILGDPRRADMKDILNLKIKRRESFRPFAPSILREAVADWFEIDGDVPFMMQVYPILAHQRGRIPAVTHVDGSGRLQTVTAADNPLYHRLIRSFARQTQVPMLLNTSFNENEPVVCSPDEALACFLRTRMDRLVLGHWTVWRDAGGSGRD